MKLLSAIVIAAAALMGGTACTTADPFDQRDFPCQEDEVLGYAPQFGPDYVGCIHIEEVRR